jgi:hypothetical protein
MHPSARGAAAVTGKIPIPRNGGLSAAFLDATPQNLGTG